MSSFKKSGTARGGRHWQVDLLRGVAVVAMVAYHLTYDLAFFGLFDVSVMRSGAGYGIGRSIGGTFVFLAGLSLYLGRGRSFGRVARRGGFVFGCGMVLTVITLLFAPEEPILFGVLHLIGASMVLAYPLLRLGLWNAPLGAAIFAVGLYVERFEIEGAWLVPFGIEPGFFMIDYWPLLPWLGVVLIGAAAGHAFYGKGPAKDPAPAPGAPRPLTFLGRRSLLVYFVHQPVLIAALVLLNVGDAAALL